MESSNDNGGSEDNEDTTEPPWVKASTTRPSRLPDPLPWVWQLSKTSCATRQSELPDLGRRVSEDGGGFRWNEQTEIVIVAHWDNDGCSIRESCHK